MKKKLFENLIAPLAFAAVVIFAGCSDPSSSGADNVDVPKGSVIAATYSGGGKVQIVFNEDGTVEFIDNDGTSARATAGSDYKVCARGTYIVTADNFAKITIIEVLSGWGEISQNDFNSYKDKGGAFTVSFSGNDLYITIDEKPLSFSTDNKNVSKPSGGTPPDQSGNKPSGSTPPAQSGPLFSNGRIDATYVARQTLTLENGKFSIAYNITFDYDNDIEGPIQGTYTQSANNITLEFAESTIFGGDEIAKATATISGDTLTLSIDYKESDGDVYTEKTSFKKCGYSDKEWEHSEQVKLSSNGDINYYENGKLCWEGTYTIMDDENASVELNKNKIHVPGSFGTDPGILRIEDASHEFLDLDLLELDERGGVAMRFAREK